MAKKRKKPLNGLIGKFLQPWKSQRVSLTKAGKNLAPLRKKSTKKTAKKVEKPLSSRERQAKEIQTMVKIGQQNPERLARIIAGMLQEIRIQEENEKLKFERLIWDKVENPRNDPDPEE